MRLIDADTLLQDLENDFSKVNKEKLSEHNYLVIRTAHIALSKFIKKQPTAYDVDNVLKQLEIYSNKDEAEQLGTIPVVELEDAFKIVKGGGIYEW